MFSPEETLLEPYSDCEDRAILFSYMVHELLGLKTIYIEYPNHIMVGVDLPDSQGTVTEYQGERYVICEPTGPQDVLEIGELPPHYRSMGFHINP